MLEALARLEKLKERAAERHRRGQPAVQPRLAPRPRPAEHAPRLGVRGAGRRSSGRRAAGATPATTTPRPSRGVAGREPDRLRPRPRRAAECRASATSSSGASRCPRCRPELLGLFERDELSKYMTDAELEAARPATSVRPRDESGRAGGDATSRPTRSAGRGAATTTGGGLQRLRRRGATRARSSSTSSTGCRPRRRPTSPSGGTARPASAARAAPR